MKNLNFFLLLTLICVGFNTAKADQPALTVAFNKAITSYLEIKNALVADDAVTAQAKAKNMAAALSTISTKDMNAAQRKAWTESSTKLIADTRQISEQSKIDQKRERFAALSSNFMAVLKAFNINKTTLYKQYCPMKNSYWLSEASAVKNPYYGATMLTCGTTQETFEAVK